MLSFCTVKLELDQDTMNAPINETAETSIIDVTTVLMPRRLLLLTVWSGLKNRILLGVSLQATTYDTFSNRNLNMEISDRLFV